ncbi:MAG: hypothetical protein HN919_09245 [Verrucomicrobia bacterium]|jgi:hypothetical protein|nr:hypothetical protein [Verrucomicrobiota bacterium]
MRTYRITFSWNNGRYEEQLSCGSAQAARKIVEARYPGATGIAVWPQ